MIWSGSQTFQSEDDKYHFTSTDIPPSSALDHLKPWLWAGTINSDIHDRKFVTSPFLCTSSASNLKSEKYGIPSKYSSHLLSNIKYQVLIIFSIPQCGPPEASQERLTVLDLGLNAVSEVVFYSFLYPRRPKIQENWRIQEVSLFFRALGPFHKTRKDPVNG